MADFDFDSARVVTIDYVPESFRPEYEARVCKMTYDGSGCR
jgi:hypothetical protein